MEWVIFFFFFFVRFTSNSNIGGSDELGKLSTVLIKD